MQISQEFALIATSRLAAKNVISTMEEESIRGLIATNHVNGMVDTSILPERLRKNLEQPAPARS